MFPFFLLLAQNSDDRDFLVQVFERFKRLIFSIANRYADTPEDAEEIFQFSVEKMVRHVETLRSLQDDKLAAYIGILTKNTAINYIKHTALINKHALPLTESDGYYKSHWFESPEDIVILLEHRELLREALSRLSLTDQTLIEGKLYLGLTDAELAEFLGCKPKSISMMLTRAKRRAIFEIMRAGQDDES